MANLGLVHLWCHLKPSADCPANAVKFRCIYYARNDGTPMKISNIFCIFGNHVGNIMWCHTELGVPGKCVTCCKWYYWCCCCYHCFFFFFYRSFYQWNYFYYYYYYYLFLGVVTIFYGKFVPCNSFIWQLYGIVDKRGKARGEDGQNSRHTNLSNMLVSILISVLLWAFSNYLDRLDY